MSQVKERVALRLASDLADEESYENPGVLQQFSNKIVRNISNAIHENTRKAQGLPPGVRAYKRNIAPLVALISLQSFDNFGFVIYRTDYSNETAYLEFVEVLDSVMTAQKENYLNGDGLEQVQDRLMISVQDEKSFEGASATACRKDFKDLRAGDILPYGLDNGILLMADDQVISTFTNLNEYRPYLWAVDVDFDPGKRNYPEGYEGVFKVVPAALLHDLFLAVGSGLMTPVDIWKVLQKKKVSDADLSDRKHDEL
jgi:hypothetical protein